MAGKDLKGMIRRARLRNPDGREGFKGEDSEGQLCSNLALYTRHEAGCVAGWLVVWLAGWLAVWLAGWLAVWLAGWLAVWLACKTKSLYMRAYQKTIVLLKVLVSTLALWICLASLGRALVQPRPACAILPLHL